MHYSEAPRLTQPAGPSVAAETATPQGTCRPREYADEIGYQILEKIGDGGKLHEICAQDGMPHPATVYRWIAEKPAFATAYHYALLARFDKKAYELIEIADDASEDYEITDGADGMPVAKPNPQTLGRTEVRLRTRMWIMARELPRKYGEVNKQAPPSLKNDDAPVSIDPPALPRPEDDPVGRALLAWKNNGIVKVER